MWRNLRQVNATLANIAQGFHSRNQIQVILVAQQFINCAPSFSLCALCDDARDLSLQLGRFCQDCGSSQRAIQDIRE